MNKSISLDWDLRQIIEMLDWIPPEEYFCYCDTESQKSHWLRLKKEYQILKVSFIQFFSGEEDTILNAFPEKQKEVYFLLRDLYLSFYTMVQGNWRKIVEEAKEVKYPIEELASSPGEAVMRVIENECMITFWKCQLSNYKESPSEIRRLINQENKILKLISTKEQFTHSEQLQVDNYRQQLTRRIEPFQDLMKLRKFCELICGKSKKGSTTHRHYLTYRKIEGQLDAACQSLIHPRNKPKGEHWVSGDCYPTM